MQFLLLMALGRLLDSRGVFPRETDKSLNLYVIYIALPALILQQVPGLEFSSHALVPLAMPWLVLPVSGLIVLMLCRLLRWSREITGALLLMVPLGNTGFLGVPMVERYFGAAVLPYAVLYDQFGSFLALSSYGTIIIALYSSGPQPGMLTVFRRLLAFPPFVALIAALLLHGVALPEWASSLFALAAKSMVPVAMVAIGVQMRLLLPKDELLPLGLGLLLRMLVTPLLFIWGSRLLHLSGPAVEVSLFETATPPMVTASVLASIAGLKPQLSSALAAYGILCAFFTLPVLYRLL